MNDNYTTISGYGIYAGIFDPNPPTAGDSFDGVNVVSEGAGLPSTSSNQVWIFELHASGGASAITNGRQYEADVSGKLSYLTYNKWKFSAVTGGTLSTGATAIKTRPTDRFDLYASSVVRESYWMGFTGMDEPSKMRLITERRLNALYTWAEQNLPVHPTKRVLTGGSMGAWGTMTYGIPRPDKFAALYPDRPRWRYNNSFDAQQFTIPDWTNAGVSYTSTTSPMLVTDDGGIKATDHMNMIAYVSNTANKIPWIGWCIGTQDGFTDFRDHQAAVAALRAAKRGFAVAWNGGNHSSGSILNQITNSYPFGTFEIGKGYPLFTNHSGDDDINTPPTNGDLTTRGINLGLTFRNVVESSTAWSCEVTSILGARTVTVEPISDVFKATVTPQNITIPAANSWVTVNFTI